MTAELFVVGLSWRTAPVAVRLGLGWRGRRTARLALAGFGAALTVLVIYFVRRAVEGA